METTSEEPNMSVESRQAYFGPNVGNSNAALLNSGLNAYGNFNQGINNRYVNGQNNLASPLIGNGGNIYPGQAISKRRFSNMGRFGNQISDADYPTGIGNGGGITGGGGDENGLNGITSTGGDQSQSQDYLDSYNQLGGSNLLSGSGGRGNGVGNQLGGFGNSNGLGAGNLNLNGNNQLLVGNRRNIANRRNGFGYGGGFGNGGGGLGDLTGYPSAYGAGNAGYGQQLPLAGVRSSGYGGGSGYGGYAPVSVISGYGQAPTECETGLNPLLTLLTLGGAAVGFYFVINKLTKGAGLFGGIGRKFQHEQYEKGKLNVFLDDVYDHFWIGLEEFENKVDRIAKGENEEDDSWLGQIYQQFKHLMKDEDGSEPQSYNVEGLEPPMFDDTWGLADDFDVMMKNETNEVGIDTLSPVSLFGERGDDFGLATHNRTKRDTGMNNTATWIQFVNEEMNRKENNNAMEDDDDSNVIEDVIGFDPIKFVPGFILGDDGTNCQKKFMKCVSGSLFKGGMEHSHDPDGISGYLRKVFFRIGFKGGFGNVWKALMDVPEARKVRRCMNKRDDCLAHEVLVSSLNSNQFMFEDDFNNKTDILPNMDLNNIEDEEKENVKTNRLLINPEFAESMDPSDGSEMFSPEDQKIEEEATRLDY